MCECWGLLLFYVNIFFIELETVQVKTVREQSPEEIFELDSLCTDYLLSLKLRMLL